MLAVWWVISSSLAPIERTRKLVAARAADDLSALPEDGLPQEILPLVHELNQLFGRVQDAFRAQQHFVADAAHELRNPLAALKLQAQALRPSGHASSMDPASSELAVVRLNQGIDRAIRLVEQLLSLARQEAQDNRDIGAAQARQKVDLQALARQAVTDALPQARAKHIDLGLISTDEAWVHASPQAVLTLLGNLLDNAIKYTPQDGQIDVDWRMQDGVMRLAIDDSGPGIDVADRPRVFDRFYRAADPAVAGSGLGLAIVKAIADRQGASVRLASSKRLGGLRVEVDFAPAQRT
jgi:two-component system OmpR family sensor kinase